MPSVAISSVAPSWLTRWRSTSRSISQASANISSAGQHEGGDVGEPAAVDAGPQRHPLGEARHRQRREQHHRALREVEHAARP